MSRAVAINPYQIFSHSAHLAQVFDHQHILFSISSQSKPLPWGSEDQGATHLAALLLKYGIGLRTVAPTSVKLTLALSQSRLRQQIVGYGS